MKGEPTLDGNHKVLVIDGGFDHFGSSWVAKMLAQEHESMWKVLTVSPDMMRAPESTAKEVELLQAAAVPRLNEIMYSFARQCGKTWRLSFKAPRRKKWDQYGAYFRRQMKKQMKRHFGFAF